MQLVKVWIYVFFRIKIVLLIYAQIRGWRFS